MDGDFVLLAQCAKALDIIPASDPIKGLIYDSDNDIILGYTRSPKRFMAEDYIYNSELNSWYIVLEVEEELVINGRDLVAYIVSEDSSPMCVRCENILIPEDFYTTIERKELLSIYNLFEKFESDLCLYESSQCSELDYIPITDLLVSTNICEACKTEALKVFNETSGVSCGV